jgi:hypothetical protein
VLVLNSLSTYLLIALVSSYIILAVLVRNDCFEHWVLSFSIALFYRPVDFPGKSRPFVLFPVAV